MSEKCGYARILNMEKVNPKIRCSGPNVGATGYCQKHLLRQQEHNNKLTKWGKVKKITRTHDDQP